jgi:phosphoribosylformylglycinamidine synthase
MSKRVPVLILHASGTNRDREAALACEMAGAAAEIVHVNQLLSGERRLADYRMLLVPGGFSYGDDLGAGKVLAVLLRYRLAEDLDTFVRLGRPVLGICNGFQALVKAGLLPGYSETGRSFTLARNDSARFECRWVYLEPQPGSRCVFTRDLAEPIYCPVAHGEGKFMARDEAGLAQLESDGLVALRYAGPAGLPPAYPWNPNGSIAHIAGICNARGNVFGLMPHPEDHVVPQQHPRYHRGERGGSGLALFANGVRYAADL